MEDVAAAILDITDRACERLKQFGATIVSDRRPEHRGGNQRSGIVAFELAGPRPAGREEALSYAAGSCSVAGPGGCESAPTHTTMKRTSID